MQKIKLRVIADAAKALDALAKIDLPPTVAFDVLQFISEIDDPLKNFEAVRFRAIEEFGKINPDGSFYVPPENQGKVFEKLSPLLEHEISVSSIPVLKPEYFSKNISVDLLYPLRFMLVNGSTPEKNSARGNRKSKTEA